MNCQPTSAKIRHRRHVGVAEKPEQRTMSVDAEHLPADAVSQARQEGPTKADRHTAAHPLCFPADAVADGYVNAFVLVIALLIGDIGDQLFVVSVSDIRQVDGVHGGA